MREMNEKLVAQCVMITKKEREIDFGRKIELSCSDFLNLIDFYDTSMLKLSRAEKRKMTVKYIISTVPKAFIISF